MNAFGRVAAWLVCCLLVASPLRAEIAGNAIESVNVAQQGNEIAVRLDMRQAMSHVPAGFAVTNPARIAFDFPSTANALGKTTEVVNQGDLRSLNVVQVGEKTRVVLNLVRNLNYRTRLDGKSIYVTLSPIDRVSDVVGERAARFSEESLVGVTHAVKDVAFRRGKEGEGRVIVELSDAGTGIDIRQQGENLVVDFLKTQLPAALRRKLDVTDFATPVVGVETREFGDNVRMTITPKGMWEHNAYQTDNQFVVEVRKIVEDPNKLVQGSKVGYQGPRVSINYQNGDVRALLRLMAEELGLNAVISETVTGTTTLVLKDVPADQVIDIVFQQKGLDMRKNGNIIMIAPRDEIATREKLDFESRQQIHDLEPLVTEQFVLNYQKASDVATLLSGGAATGGGANQRILGKRGSAVADPQSNILFVSDIPAKLEEIRSFIRTIDVGVRQVLIEARIVEANDDFSKSLGMKLNLLSNRSEAADPLGGGNYRLRGGAGGLGDSSIFNTNLPAGLDGQGRGGMFAFSLFNASYTRILNMEVNALQADGLGKVISSPRVVTANNKKAKIEDGDEVPVVTPGTATSPPTTTYRPVKLSLEVTPQITPDGTVKMDLLVKKESADTERNPVNPPIKSSVVDTSVIVENGGTVIIGGVYTTDRRDGVEKVPLLGDIPVLGWAFKAKNETHKRRELLIFITPRIISDKLRLN